MIDFTNYKIHSTKKDFMVFHFDHKDQSLYFEQLLTQNNLFFEKHLENEKNFLVYYGIRKSDFTKVNELNNISNGKFRKPFISDKYLRYTVLSLFFIMMALAVTGMIVNALK
ncbi:MAG: hypothetical protein H0V01_12315 [Bacteroidetes bacterium]|nr:hypothetical protein [Bacteroidota bacterium]HET6245844.1 hypothetical protein [Bacteroidia bacterium]